MSTCKVLYYTSKKSENPVFSTKFKTSFKCPETKNEANRSASWIHPSTRIADSASVNGKNGKSIVCS